MNLFNRLFFNKPVKLFYYLNSGLRYVEPKWLFQKKREKLLQTVQDRTDKAYIEDRVNYYNKLQPGQSAADLRPLGEHRFRRHLKSVYFFDTYEYTRWFPDTLRWHYLEGDITRVPPIPSIVKSRPVNGDNGCSVLLNLDKIRHFVFLRDHIPFGQKQDKAIFRLSIQRKPHRIRFMEMHFGTSYCDAGTTGRVDGLPENWVRPKISLYDHLSFKFIIALEGNDVATNLKWVMSTNSIAVMPRPTYETWFMEGRLIPDYHYIEIKSDFSDLEERLSYYAQHVAEAEAIIRHAHEYIAQFRDRRREKLISLLVLEKYFRQTGQLP